MKFVSQRWTLAIVCLALILAMGGGLAAPARADATATIALPKVTLAPGAQTVLPVTLDTAGAEVVAIDLRIVWNPQIVSLEDVALGAQADGWIHSSNLVTPGELRVAMAGMQPVNGSGELLTLTVKAVGGAGGQTALTFSTASLNDGAVTSAPSHGRVTIEGEAPVYEIDLPLVLGWNLISLPVTPESATIGDILAPIAGMYDLVFMYDAADAADPWQSYRPGIPAFACDIDQVDTRRALWIRMNQPATLTVRGTAPSGAVDLRAGWNLVAYPGQSAQPVASAISGLAGQVDLVYGFDAADPLSPWKVYNPSGPLDENDLTQLEPGMGYWLLVNQDCLWQTAS